MIRWDLIDPEILTEAELLVGYDASAAEAGEPGQDALTAEIERSRLDL